MTTLILISFALVVGIYIGFLLGFSRAIRQAADKLHRSESPVVAKIVIGAGCAVLIGALISLLQTLRFTSLAKRAVGEVVAMREKAGTESGGATYAPTFRFVDSSGAQRDVSSSLYSSPPEFRVGDKVPVLFRSDDPGVARIDSFWQIWGVSTVLGIVGSVTSVGGLAMLYWPRFKARFR